MFNKINHLSFIMDGNKRWSKKNKKKSYDGYFIGAKKLISISSYIFKNHDINLISAFALSKQNLERSSTVINTLRRVLDHFLENQGKLLNRNFQINFKGDFSFLNKLTIQKINDLQNKNPKCKKKLIIYINYSGKNDIIEAYNKFSSLKSNRKLTDKLIKDHLYSGNFPDPDILIRTGGYQRISDFMLYQISFTELMFTNKLWPDLLNSDIDKFINKYNKIERKFGL